MHFNTHFLLVFSRFSFHQRWLRASFVRNAKFVAVEDLHVFIAPNEESVCSRIFNQTTPKPGLLPQPVWLTSSIPSLSECVYPTPAKRGPKPKKAASASSNRSTQLPESVPTSPATSMALTPVTQMAFEELLQKYNALRVELQVESRLTEHCTLPSKIKFRDKTLSNTFHMQISLYS